MYAIRQNNFDLIRLFAASQVMVIHGLHHLDILDTVSAPLARVANFFPGVPIFFFISGFLVSASYQRSNGMRDFFRKRALRIFPGLWVCLAVSLALVAATGYFARQAPGPIELVGWLLAQISIVQFYNPDFLRGYGVGTLNGSLWTISVELQFYILVPLAAFFIGLRRWLLGAALVFFLCANAAYSLFALPALGSSPLVALIGVTFVPWFGMFLLGYLAQLNWERLRPLVEGRFLMWLAIYAVLIAAGIMLENSTGMRLSGNRLQFPWFVTLCLLALAAAHTRPAVSDRLLDGNDVSYGIYIYHMPVINFVLATGLATGLTALSAAMAGTVLLAVLSWFAVERPALRLKRTALHAR